MTDSKWYTINTFDDLEKIIRESQQSYQLIFKHSYSCGISSLIKNRLLKEHQAFDHHIPVHLIDVVKKREISNQIASRFQVRHESPQLLLISDDQCSFHTSHFDVSLTKIPVKSEE